MKLRQLTRIAATAAVAAAAATASLVAATPAFAAAAATVTPNTGLTDGHAIVVAGTGFPALIPVQLIECAGTSTTPPVDNTSCDGLSLDNSSYATNSAGTIALQAGATPVIHTINPKDGTAGGIIDTSGQVCDSTHACVLFVGQDQTNFALPHVFLDIAFTGPPASAVAPTGTVDLSPNPYVLSYSSSGATYTFNPSTTVAGHDSHGVLETLNTPVVTAVGTHTGNLVCASATSCTYTGVGATTTAYGPDSFNLTFTATVAGGGATSVASLPIGPYSFSVQARPLGNTTITGTSLPSTSTTPVGVITNAGATSIQVVNSTLFAPGDTIVIDPGVYSGSTLIAETRVITTITPGTAPAGTLNFATPLVYTHDATVVDLTSGTGSIEQVIQVPLAAGSISMSEATGLGANNEPIDVLSGTVATTLGGNQTCTAQTTTPGSLTLTGQPLFACGILSPITVTNGLGNDAPWNVTGQVTDFVDNGATPPSTPVCDTVATFSDHCIPGGNLQWDPVAAIANALVPGDVATVTAGPETAPATFYPADTLHLAPSLALPGVKTPTGATSQGTATLGAPAMAGWNVGGVPGAYGIAPTANLRSGGETLCSAAAGTSGGTFACGAFLELAVPASTAANHSPFTATLTLTLS